jgi:hypothetical protein
MSLTTPQKTGRPSKRVKLENGYPYDSTVLSRGASAPLVGPINDMRSPPLMLGMHDGETRSHCRTLQRPTARLARSAPLVLSMCVYRRRDP